MEGGGPAAASRPAPPPRTAPPHRDPRRTERGPSGTRGRGLSRAPGRDPATAGRDPRTLDRELVHQELSREKHKP